MLLLSQDQTFAFIQSSRIWAFYKLHGRRNLRLPSVVVSRHGWKQVLGLETTPNMASFYNFEVSRNEEKIHIMLQVVRVGFGTDPGRFERLGFHLVCRTSLLRSRKRSTKAPQTILLFAELSKNPRRTAKVTSNKPKGNLPVRTLREPFGNRPFEVPSQSRSHFPFGGKFSKSDSLRVSAGRTQVKLKITALNNKTVSGWLQEWRMTHVLHKKTTEKRPIVYVSLIICSELNTLSFQIWPRLEPTVDLLTFYPQWCWFKSISQSVQQGKVTGCEENIVRLKRGCLTKCLQMTYISSTGSYPWKQEL